MSLDSEIEGAKETLAASLLRKEKENRNAEKDPMIIDIVEKKPNVVMDPKKDNSKEQRRITTK